MSPPLIHCPRLHYEAVHSSVRVSGGSPAVAADNKVNAGTHTGKPPLMNDLNKQYNIVSATELLQKRCAHAYVYTALRCCKTHCSVATIMGSIEVNSDILR